MPNIRLTLAYDGAAYCGWQVQPAARTVQGELQAAIEALTGERVNLLSAGRTDSGVHALGQVANFITAATIPAEKWRPALQGKLPRDIAILDSREVPAEFHATYSAVSKRYRYVIRLGVVDDPFVGQYAWRIGGDLDVGAMQAAARALLGTHDFRCFETEWPNKATSVRTIHDVGLASVARWPAWSPVQLLPLPCGARAGVRGETASTGGATGSASANPGATGSASTNLGAGSAGAHSELPAATFERGQSPWHPESFAEFLCFEIEANGFLYNMVRAIVGTLVNVGRGKWPVDSMARIIAARDRSAAGETAPAHGLYLVRVRYPGDDT